MNFNQGDIVVLELPFSDLVGSKLRPVLIVSNIKYNNTGNDVIVAKISSIYHDTKWETKLTNSGLSKGNLKKTSYIDSGFLFTIEKEIIRKSIAKLKEENLKKILSNIGKIMKIDPY